MPKTEKDIAKIESAILQKYGIEVAKDFSSEWNEEKEKLYLEQLKISPEEEIQEKENVGFLIVKKLFNRQEETCPICRVYSVSVNDKTYMIKYECCEKCFIQHVEGREDKWEVKKQTLKGLKNENK